MITDTELAWFDEGIRCDNRFDISAPHLAKLIARLRAAEAIVKDDAEDDDVIYNDYESRFCRYCWAVVFHAPDENVMPPEHNADCTHIRARAHLAAVRGEGA